MSPVELLSQDHNGQEVLVAFLSHTFTDTKLKWSTPEKEAYGVYFAVTKWNHYLQGSGIVMCNDHKPLQKFLNGKNANNKVNRWSLELATYNITFEWISGTHNKAADCLSWLVDVKDTPATSSASLNMVVLPPTPAVRPLHLQILHHLQMFNPPQHQTLTQSMHPHLSWRTTKTLSN